MDNEIKKYADDGDIKSLKYYFVDSLDIDPTFVRYEEDYKYCKNTPGLLEQHIELTPFVFDQEKWTEDYWTKLKMDLLKNFSDKRMEHMKDVAKVLLSDKVKNILAEREMKKNSSQTDHIQLINQKNDDKETKLHDIDDVNILGPMRNLTNVKQSKKEDQEKQKLEKQKKIEEHNRKIEEEQKRNEERMEKMRQSNESINRQLNNRSSKKTLGIAVIIVVVIIILILLLIK